MSRHIRLSNLVVVCAVTSALSLLPAVAQAVTGPMLPSHAIVSEGFETALPSNLTLDWVVSTGYPTSAYWGRITQQKHSGSYGLWCAGSIPNSGSTTAWTTFGGLYPSYTAGLADFSVPDLGDYYSATLDYWYRMPSLGSEDGDRFNVLWQPASNGGGGGWDYHTSWETTSTWTHAVMDLTSSTPHVYNMSRTAGTIRFQFMDDAGNYGENPTNGEGPTIDDVTVSGYKYGPVRNLSATVVDTGLLLSWSVPARSTALLAPDEERPLAYRVYRELDGSNVWTELTGTRITGTSFYDLDTSALVGTYRYVVQAWDTGFGPGYGQVAMTGDTTTQFFVGPKYTLSYGAAAHGSIVGSSTQVVGAGTSGTAVTAAPATGYHFVSWSDGDPTATRTDANVTADLNVIASFAIDTYHLAYAAGSGGTISGAISQTVDYGTAGTAVTAVPNLGYHLTGWSDGAPTATRTDTNVTGDLSASASFAVNTYHLAYAAGSGGTISGTASQTVAYNGSGSAVTAVAGGGHHFVSWSDGVTSATRTDGGITGDIAVSAVFAVDVPNSYTLAYTASTGGSVEGSATQLVASGGAGTAVTASADPGHRFVSWSDGEGSATRTDANVTRDILVSASFALDTYQLHYAAAANGTISGTASQTVGYGGSGTAVTAVPSAGYHFVSWSDGGTNPTRTETDVTAGKSVSASFAINTYQLHYTAAANGSISGTASQTVGYGGSGTAVIAFADPGYHFVTWSDGGASATRTDKAVTSDLNVSASFAADPPGPVFTITGVPDLPTRLAVTPGYSTNDVPAPTVEAWIDGTPFDMFTTYSADGTHTLVVRLTGAGASTWHSKVFVIDDTAPVTLNNLPKTVALTSLTVLLSAKDNVSGVAKTYYSLDGAAFKTYTGGLLVTSWKDHTIAYYSVDVLGNVEGTHHIKFSMRQPETLSIASSTSSPTHGHSFTLSGYLAPAGSNYKLTLKYQRPGSSKWYSVTRYTVKTGTRGKWTYTYTPSAKGTYHFKISYAGSTTKNKADSLTLAVRVD